MTDYVTIYGLSDPITGELRYIGKTITSLKRRLASHMGKINWQDNPRTAWLRELHERGMRPDIFEVENVSAEYAIWTEAESFWISYFRFVGAALVNVTMGGDGRLFKHCASSIEKMRLVHRGKPKTEAAKRKMSIAKKLFMADPKNREHLSRIKTGTKASPEAREKIRLAAIGRVVSEETRRKKSLALKGRPGKPMPEEVRRKVSESQRGRKQNEKTLAALRVLAASRKGVPRALWAKSKKPKWPYLTDPTLNATG